MTQILHTYGLGQIQFDYHENVFLVTSSIFTGDTNTAFYSIQRFEQTIKTLKSIREKIHDVIIIFIDTDILPKPWEITIQSHCDIYIHQNNRKIYPQTKIKTIGEYLTSTCVYDKLDKTKFKRLFKLSGRYFLNDNFNIDIFHEEKCTFYDLRIKHEALGTVLYCIPSQCYDKFIQEWKKLIHDILWGYNLEVSLFQNICPDIIHHYTGVYGVEGLITDGRAWSL